MSAMQRYNQQLESEKHLLVESWSRMMTTSNPETHEKMSKIVERLRSELPKIIVEECRLSANALIAGIEGKRQDDWLFNDYEE